MQRCRDYTLVDLETTGLSIKKRSIIEYALIKVRDSKIVDKKTGFVNPRVKLRQITVEITNITDDMLKDAPYIEDILEDIINFIGEDILIGHNILMDYSFLKKECIKKDIKFNKKAIDTLEICRKFMPLDKKKNLKEACEFYNIETKNSHRAYNDVYNTYLLYEKLADLYADEEIFIAKELNYKYKVEKKADKRVKESLIKFLKYHKINIDFDIEKLSQNEISRIRDNIKNKKFIYLEEKNEEE